MSGQKTPINQLSDWETICFPVATRPLQSLLPSHYRVGASDRQMAVVASLRDEADTPYETITAIQSSGYSLIPNRLIRDAVNEVFPDYTLNIRTTNNFEYSIQVVLPEMLKIGTEYMQKSIILTNSYNGKTKFSLMGKTADKRVESGMKVSFYRLICTNGMMGWVDQFMSMDDYLEWLVKSDSVREKTKTEFVERHITEREEQVMQQIFSHKGINLNLFYKYLVKSFREINDHTTNLTLEVYNQMTGVTLTAEKIERMARSVKIPASLIKSALDRMELEMVALHQELPTAWLAYNGINHALLNETSSLGIAERYAADERVFHTFARESMWN